MLCACSRWQCCTCQRRMHTRTSLCSAAYSICAWDVNHLARPNLLRRPAKRHRGVTALHVPDTASPAVQLDAGACTHGWHRSEDTAPAVLLCTHRR